MYNGVEIIEKRAKTHFPVKILATPQIAIRRVRIISRLNNTISGKLLYGLFV